MEQITGIGSEFGYIGHDAQRDQIEIIVGAIGLPCEVEHLLRQFEGDARAACRTGTCGNCAVKVLDGQPVHRDSVLTEDERTSGRKMCICVSRAQGDHLRLDL